MKIELLRTFLEVSRTLHFRIASENLLLNLYACYAGKLAGSLSSENRIIAQERMNNASSTISDQIIPTKTLLERGIEASNNNLDRLEELAEGITFAETAEEVGIITNELILFDLSGVLNESNISGAQQENAVITAQMSSLDSTTQSQIETCQNFPPPPPPTIIYR